MSPHSQSFEAEREIAPDKVERLLLKPVQAAPAPLQVQASRGKFEQVLLAGAAAVVLAAAGWYGWDYWTVGRFLVSTDDAYVKADNTTIAPKVSGYLVSVLVGDNEHVKAGQVLARIDDRDFKVALDQAKADVAAAEAAVASKRAQLEVQQAVIEAAKATLDVDTAAKIFAEQENKRYTDLAATGYGSVQNAQNAQARDAGAKAAIARDIANLSPRKSRSNCSRPRSRRPSRPPRARDAVQRQAELNLGYTTITAPIDGVVGNRTLRVGQFVQAGTQLMSLVPATGAYVIANFKETQLTDVHAGQKVDIEVDMFPGKTCTAMSIQLAPASGQEFALLPPDNATGNFTKVVQRIPVKIALEGDAPIELRPGMSVIPTIETMPRHETRRTARAVTPRGSPTQFTEVMPCPTSLSPCGLRHARPASRPMPRQSGAPAPPFGLPCSPP